MEKNTKHTISLYVKNKPGVLIRISLVFARRGYNIDSLVVSESNDPEFSRMTITGTGDPKTLDLMLKQLNKLVDVISARDMTGENVISKELAMFKITCPQDNRTDILQTANAFNAKILDIGSETVTIQITGNSDKLDNAAAVFKPFGIVETVRTGKVLISRGNLRT
ncbi:MAG: acetolactate synthase small subunit [Spirochaetales bacterium]|nr:acetolactate synthase small subunit [Spirochaetales bacterium]